MRRIVTVVTTLLVMVFANPSYGQSVLATFDVGSSDVVAVTRNGCATIDSGAGKHGGALKIACRKGQSFFVQPRNRAIGFPGNLAFNLRIEVPPATTNVTFVYYALMGLTGQITADSRVRFAQFDAYTGTFVDEVLSPPLGNAYHTIVMLQSETNRLYVDGVEVGSLPGLASQPVADLALIASHGCPANDCTDLGVQDALTIDLDDLVAREDETVPSGPISGGVMRASSCHNCTWDGVGSRCPGCDKSVCRSCRSACCETQAPLTVDDPLVPDDSKTSMLSRGIDAVETFGHTAVVPAGRPIVGTLLQARMRNNAVSANPSLLLQVDGMDFLTPCVIPLGRWSSCHAYPGGAGRVDLVNPATRAPWTATDLDAASIGVQHPPSKAPAGLTWISWEVIYED